jgi:hypothetical protein
MTQQGQNEPQVEITPASPQPGSENQVVEQPSADTQPGAEGMPQKTYSQEEWNAREKTTTESRATSDKQMSLARALVAENAMRQQIREAENQAQAKDRQEVEDGEITQGQAQQRQQTRYQGWQQEIMRRQTVAQDQAEHVKLVAENEDMARVRTADLLAKDHGVEMDVLLADKSLTTGPAMEIKARELAIDKKMAELKGFESFDSGQSGGSGVSVANMSALEKISYGVAHPPKRAR